MRRGIGLRHCRLDVRAPVRLGLGALFGMFVALVFVIVPLVMMTTVQ
jgi:hypothetical protein